jgi:hypothetical protein
MKIKRITLPLGLFLAIFTPLFYQIPEYTWLPLTEQRIHVFPKSGAAIAQPTKPIATSTKEARPPSSAIHSYDPRMDNHLHAPPAEKPIGLFGKPIKEVEKILDQYGAKNYSYAFGKYSRMRISPYLLTMYFDRQRRLGGLAIEPMAPYKYIAPSARKFFLELFLQKQSMEKFKTIISRNRLELRYQPD